MNAQRRAILLAIGGGIAAYKSATVCSRLVQSENDLRVAMTRSATQFVGASTFSALSGKPVALDGDDSSLYPLGAHIELARDISLMIVAPATANLIGKFATGIADCLISTMYLQAECPILIAPAMSATMWSKPAVSRNIDTLRQDGCQLVGPETGWLSCRVKGEGRMAEPEQIIEAALEIIDTKGSS